MKKIFVLLLFTISIYSCKKDAQQSATLADKIEKTAYQEMSGTWILIDGLCEGGCAWRKPDLSVDNFLTINQDRTYEYKTDKNISKGTFVFRYDVRCGSLRSDSTLLFVVTNAINDKLSPSKTELMLAPSILLKSDTLKMINLDCMVDGHGYMTYKKHR